MTVAPCCTRICFTTPARSASMLFSIFMASSTTSVCPAATVSPHGHLHAQHGARQRAFHAGTRRRRRGSDARRRSGRRGSDHGAVGRLGGRGHLGFGDRRGFRVLDLDFVIHAVDHDVRYRRGLVHVVDLDVVIMSVDFQRVIFHFLFWVVLFRRRVLSPVGKLG